MAAAANDSLADEKAPGTIGVGRYEEMEQDGGGSSTAKSRLSGLLWHGGSAYDAWFSCASNQVMSDIHSCPCDLNHVCRAVLET
jgi:auxin influx carrier (AUX1 LAX family)